MTRKLDDGWSEVYLCGCDSPTVRRKRDLLGYCPVHGEDRQELLHNGGPGNRKTLERMLAALKEVKE